MTLVLIAIIYIKNISSQSSTIIGVKATFGQGEGGGSVNHLPKNPHKLPKFLQNSRKETRVIWGTNIGLHIKWKYSYLWIYHMSS